MAKHFEERKFKIFSKPVVILLIIVLVSIPAMVYAKYYYDVIGKSISDIDTVYYSIEKLTTETQSLNSKKITTFYFNVNNYDSDNNLNQVLMEYYIKILADNTNFEKNIKLYYQKESNNWVELPIITSGEHIGFYKAQANLTFDGPKSNKYKIDIVSTDEILVNENFNINIDISLVQAES